ncbi:hypothetical protein, partial [Salmonella enterica]
ITFSGVILNLSLFRNKYPPPIFCIITIDKNNAYHSICASYRFSEISRGNAIGSRISPPEPFIPWRSPAAHKKSAGEPAPEERVMRY